MIFDRFDPAFRSPTGAVSEKTTVSFTLRPLRRMGVSRIFLSVTRDGGDAVLTPLTWTGTEIADEGVADVWKTQVLFDTAGLYWYNFIIETGNGRVILQEDGDVPFQQTVYERDFCTPDWLANGVMYQIFPDRFFRGGGAKTPDRGRTLHASWEEEPAYDNDPCCITNSDFFGGDLRGVEQKLDYLASLGVTVIYLNPIFEAFSNHRYDTGDYEKIDPLLGTQDDFASLCKAAKARGMRVLLDGVFSHTGADSRYFDKFGRYDEPGASRSQESRFYPWYTFSHYPDRYTCWWDVWSLPCVNETEPSYLDFITGENGIARRYIRLGASGWRLDVADELPDGFLDAFRAAVKAEDPGAAVIGEVWEDASNKVAYSHRRRYLLGRELDSVMNYPFRTAILRFVREGDAAGLVDTVRSIAEHYPPQVMREVMNMLSTHDTPRALTALAGEPVNGRDRDWQHRTHLSKHDRARGIRLLKAAAAVQYTLPGIPSLYYGDEAGMEGYGDPFNRAPFPWGREDSDLTEWFRFLADVRRAIDPAAPFTPLYASKGLLAYRRGKVTVLVNVTDKDADLCGETVERESAKFLLR